MESMVAEVFQKGTLQREHPKAVRFVFLSGLE
jgi:hypothetical protein